MFDLIRMPLHNIHADHTLGLARLTAVIRKELKFGPSKACGRKKILPFDNPPNKKGEIVRKNGNFLLLI